MGVELILVHQGQVRIQDVINGHIMLKMEVFDLYSMDDVYLLIATVV